LPPFDRPFRGGRSSSYATLPVPPAKSESVHVNQKFGFSRQRDQERIMERFMSPPKFEIQRLQEQGNTARMEFIQTGDLKAFRRMIAAYREAYKLVSSQSSRGAQSPMDPMISSPMDPLINTAGRNADQAARKLKELRKELEKAGDNPPPGLLMKIQIATQAYQAWFTCLKSCADSKGQVQGELARFR